MIRKILCFFGYHRWKNIDDSPMPEVPVGGSVTYSELHECECCKKREYLGMGTLY